MIYTLSLSFNIMALFWCQILLIARNLERCGNFFPRNSGKTLLNRAGGRALQRMLRFVPGAAALEEVRFLMHQPPSLKGGFEGRSARAALAEQISHH